MQTIKDLLVIAVPVLMLVSGASNVAAKNYCQSGAGGIVLEGECSPMGGYRCGSGGWNKVSTCGDYKGLAAQNPTKTPVASAFRGSQPTNTGQDQPRVNGKTETGIPYSQIVVGTGGAGPTIPCDPGTTWNGHGCVDDGPSMTGGKNGCKSPNTWNGSACVDASNPRLKRQPDSIK
jgi:hypothetical protein